MSRRDGISQAILTFIGLLIAAVVLLIPALRDDGSSVPTATTASAPTSTGGGPTLAVTASKDGSTFSPTRLSVDTPGPFSISLNNPGASERRLLVLGGDGAVAWGRWLARRAASPRTM